MIKMVISQLQLIFEPPGARETFLKEIFDTDKVRDAFSGTEATADEQETAKKHFLLLINK